MVISLRKDIPGVKPWNVFFLLFRAMHIFSASSYIEIREVLGMSTKLTEIFPAAYRSCFVMADKRAELVSEIRLRMAQPAILMEGTKEFFLRKDGAYTDKMEQAWCPDRQALTEIVSHLCQYSLYAYEDELRQGYITIEGGHRVGIAGQAVQESEGAIRTIKHISAINIRVAHQILRAADPVLPYVYAKGMIRNTLIVSPPGCGKTTLLRDLVRQISCGNAYGPGRTVGIVDERSEIAGCYMGQPQNDLGPRSDVLDACPKALGMMMLLRSMSPAVLAVDELGSKEEIRALRMAASCGVSLVATIHGMDMQDVQGKPEMGALLSEGIFTCMLLLGRDVQGNCRVRAVLHRRRINGAWEVVAGDDKAVRV